MKGLIEATYNDDEEAKKEIDEGKFQILTKDGIVLSHLWEMLVEPEWKVRIRLGSQDHRKVDSSPNPESEYDKDRNKSGLEKDSGSKASYALGVKYTIDYHRKRPWSTGYEFWHSMSFDNPVALKTSEIKDQALPVLEETKSILMDESHDGRRKRVSSKEPPKLHFGDRIGRTRLFICSPFLLNALRAIIKHSSEEPSGEDEENDGGPPHVHGDPSYRR
jgi:hypothetical protein